MGGSVKQTVWGLAMLCGLVSVWGWAAWGATLVAESFVTTGQGYADWYWLHQQGHAQWDFFALPAGADPHVAVEAFVCLSLPNGGAPAAIEVRLHVTTAAVSAPRVFVARLNRVQMNHAHALYFGQLFLSRRELGLGSRLTVRVEGTQSRVPFGVHPSSIRVAVPSGGTVSPVLAAATPAGQGGGWEEIAGIVPGAAPAPTVTRTLPVSEVAVSAPFLAPGTYHGTLGWPGPYERPNGKGLYRVNLRAGEVVTVQVETTSPCALYLLDPSGRKVGEIEGSSWLGLEYRAHVSGAWQILVVCRSGGPQFPYTLTLRIR